MGTRRFLWCALAIVTLAWAGCSDDSGDGDSDDDGGQTLEPGREVAGCFDCSATEYCLLFGGVGETESYRCAEASCGLECACIEEDGKKRHAECATGSCQQGSGLLYCAG